MRTHHSAEENRRLSLLLPVSLSEELSTIADEEHKSKTGIVRQALTHWFEVRRMNKMKEGYLAMAAEDQKIMAEFKHVDSDVW